MIAHTKSIKITLQVHMYHLSTALLDQVHFHNHAWPITFTYKLCGFATGSSCTIKHI